MVAADVAADAGSGWWQRMVAADAGGGCGQRMWAADVGSGWWQRMESATSADPFRIPVSLSA
jgi:hypothetical protein